MGKNLAEFQLLGIDVKVHWSFILILAFGAFIYGAGPAGWLVGGLYGVVTFLLLFVCVTLHEYGHALTARHYGIRTRSILLLPIGGVANLERMPEKPHQEMVIAIAGPLVNFAIAALLVPIVFLIGGVEAGGSLGQTSVLNDNLRAPGLVNLLLYLFMTNVLLALFNLLPAFPMDGGRLLRALLAMVIPYMQATRVAVLIGRLVAVAMAVYGIFTGGITLMLVAFFVYVGGSAELEAVSSRAVLRSVQAGAAIAPGAINLYISERLERAMNLILTTYQTDYPVLDLGGRFAGVLTRQRLVSALRELGPDTRIVEVMAPSSEVPEVQASADLATVWEVMSQHGSRIVAVRNGSQFAGILTSDDISEVFQVVGAALEGRQRHQPPAAPTAGTAPPALDTWADPPDVLPAVGSADLGAAPGTGLETADNMPPSTAPEQEKKNA